ncbi:hypothetical protein SAMN05216207_100747 [Pseudonocardia ammonioxydans]|uniref:Uncharacterized protein n=1 Tax=Pseudonocardia ammonioxydans TaxID=260086 RepID=A0A1I4VXX6_PSUAM|nr:hypothetical protein [Pseudonocardia ammonioxydans]SFN05809.1 hypothetical protein SAMN05216207_100747 [Pseudonocardia ammonioxydans]
MVRVEGHWRNRSWVRTHYRHPLRPEADQTGLVFPPVRFVRIDLAAHGGPFPAEPVSARPGPALPSPRPPGDGAP